jgi:serine protease Do
MTKTKLSYVLLFVFVILIFFTSSNWTAFFQTKNLKLESPILKLINEQQGKGSAVHIGNGYILTAAHNLTPQNLQLYTESEQSVASKLLWISYDYDIALLKIDESLPIDSFQINCTTLKVNDTMYFLGHPLNLDFVKVKGIVIKSSVVDLSPLWKSVTVVQAPIAPGMSGGAAIDKNNMLAGIIVGVMTLEQAILGIAYIVPSEALCMLIAKNEGK